MCVYVRMLVCACDHVFRTTGTTSISRTVGVCTMLIYPLRFLLMIIMIIVISVGIIVFTSTFARTLVVL